jgi:hypothetical protein
MIKVIYNTGAKELAQSMFERDVADEELAAAAGALDDSTLTVSVWKRLELRVEMQHQHVEEFTLMFRRDIAGEVYIWNDRIEKKQGAPRGALLSCHLAQVENAPRIGVKRMELYAAGDRKDTRYNGYFVWPLYGYDAPLTSADQRLLAAELAGAQTIQDIFARGGDAWWSQHGDARKMIFDLAPDSPMMKRLQNYLKRKRKGEKL